jgi:pimeloyl-ACP methyl ester carboxylesterase
MPYASSGGVRLYYEEAGAGTPILFVHEMASDLRQWEQQVRYFSRQFRCIAYNARGYSPSDIPPNDDDYLYERFVEDVGAVLDHLGVERAYLVGWSMGAYAALVFGLRRPQRVKGIVAAGVGSGSARGETESFRTSIAALAASWREKGSATCAEFIGASASRLQLKRKDPRGWASFVKDLAEHSAEGMALTILNYQGRRPSLFDFEDEFKAMKTPVLLALGDEDHACIETNLFLKRTIPGAGVWMAPQTGHAPNLEDPAAFNRAAHDFIDAVERGAWAMGEQ